MKRRFFHSSFVLAGLLMALANADASPAFDHSHAGFGEVLDRFVRGGLVDYAALKANSDALDSYLGRLSAVTESDFKDWAEAQQIAFLVNAYNAWTLRLIIDHYPVRSIKDIGWFLKGPWDQEIVRLFGRTLTLDTVEHKMLRRDYREPRIHFALVCAARGCPPLRAWPYTADTLDLQLEEQGRRFLRDDAKNSVDATARVVYLSPLFKWFDGDFEAEAGSVLNFVAPYFPEEARGLVERGGFRIKYTDYDWSLNDLKGANRETNGGTTHRHD